MSKAHKDTKDKQAQITPFLKAPFGRSRLACTGAGHYGC